MVAAPAMTVPYQRHKLVGVAEGTTVNEQEFSRRLDALPACRTQKDRKPFLPFTT
jgi:hypothetical protein